QNWLSNTTPESRQRVAAKNGALSQALNGDLLRISLRHRPHHWNHRTPIYTKPERQCNPELEKSTPFRLIPHDLTLTRRFHRTPCLVVAPSVTTPYTLADLGCCFSRQQWRPNREKLSLLLFNYFQ
ncbi:hypothetical protein GBA52_026633, partial [Prunus armeniaca]